MDGTNGLFLQGSPVEKRLTRLEIDKGMIPVLVSYWDQPNKVAEILGTGTQARVFVTGPVEERLILVGDIAVCFGNKTLGELPLPWVELESPDSWHSRCTLSQEVSRPDVRIGSLYKLTNFPLPRFALGISDLARALRSTYRGVVSLIDMQFGYSTDDLVRSTVGGDIIGLSATFGQHDIFEDCLEGIISSVAEDALIVVGGSLPALNSEFLLEKYPRLIIATGSGEPTMVDVLRFWDGSLDPHEIRGALISTTLSARKNGRKRMSRSREQSVFLPELDLLRDTLLSKGVFQLELSRGCTHACSFCPRKHKGVWVGSDASALEFVLQQAGKTFDALEARRKIFFVDEEFIGQPQDVDPVSRAIECASLVHQYGYAWETSSRIDQVYRDDRPDEWNAARAAMWRRLPQLGLERVLFGVESGVDSILERFNKRTNADQTVRALQTVTAVGVPIRTTYITFDPLMDFDELSKSYEFLGRADILRPRNSETAVNSFEKPNATSDHAVGEPFYTSISYMLVSMECLVGAPYTAKVREHGLLGDFDPMMGRFHARYVDPAIGRMSTWSQLWIDRHFAFDYTLKSIEKLSSGDERTMVRAVRRILKESAYNILGEFLLSYDRVLNNPVALEEICEDQLSTLRKRVSKAIINLKLTSDDIMEKLVQEHSKWQQWDSWKLINEL